MSEPIKNIEYLNQRLTELGITAEQNTFTRVWMNKYDDKDEKTGKIINKEGELKRDYQILDADEQGNIVIHYFDLQGQPYRWKKEETKMTRDFIRKRLREPKGDFKYWQDGGSPQFPFFPPIIIQKYKLAKAGQELGHIDILYMVEGEFKSFKGSVCGIDIFGVPSIHGFYNGDVRGKLHEDIQDLIITCKVKKIVFLHDADVLSVKWAEGKDLSLRPSGFYASIKSFRESLQLLIDDEAIELKNVYYMHIKLKFMNDAKGLDDLLCKYPALVVEVQEDLASLNFAKKYFDGFSILDQNKDVHGRIFRYLGLSDEQEFYKTYKDFIGPQEFKFKRRRYVYDQEAKEVKFVRHEDADKFMRIGPDWVKVISKLNKYGEVEEEIVPWKKTEITSDYKKFPDFMEQCQRYDDFCNEPNWNGEYKRVHNGCFNLCNPLRWTAKEGSITSSAKFLKHIFQGNGNIILDDQGRFEKEESAIGDPFTVALDYLSILLKHPKHMLPVPILVSTENGTGKSTFLKWLQLIFGSNMCILGNEQFKMKFNGHYITKFIIAIDEGFLEVDKKSEKERLKQLVTADSAFLENKGMNVRKINYYGKLIICSNDADRVMKIEDGESRWFVVKVPVIKKEEMDPDLEVKLKLEAEAWLHFLYTRPIIHPRSHRLWFNPEWFITDQFRVIVETTKNRVDRVFEDWLREQFLLYKIPVLRYSMKHLTEVFNDPKNSKYKIDAIEIKAFLAGKHMLQEVTQRIKIPVGFDFPEESSQLMPKIIYNSSVQRPYVFRVEEWLTAEMMEEFKKPLFNDAGQLVTKIDEAVPSRPKTDEELPF
jgi:hypothetical protein